MNRTSSFKCSTDTITWLFTKAEVVFAQYESVYFLTHSSALGVMNLTHWDYMAIFCCFPFYVY